jgi:RNA polymerase sigma factor (sigma-70 family)
VDQLDHSPNHPAATDEVDTPFRRFCTDGDADALGRVFAATAPWLTRRAMQLTRDPAVAVDLVQATFVTAIETRHRFDVTASARPWLLGILQHKARQHAARRTTAPAPAELPSRDDGPLTLAARAELAQLATRQIDSLPEPYRTVLQRALLREETAEQIAAALGRSPATVRSQVRRGLDRLRRGLPMVLHALLRAFGGAGRAAAVAAGVTVVAGVCYLAMRTEAVGTPVGATNATTPSIAAATPGAPAAVVPANATTAEAPLLRSAAVDVPPPRAERALEIRVVRAIDREPLPGVELAVAIDGGATQQVDTDALGIARILADADAVQANVVAPFSSARGEFALKPLATDSGAGRFGPIELVIPPGLAVVGQVLDVDGQPAAAATVWRADAERQTRIANADESGRFVALDLQPGRQHQILARLGDRRSAAIDVIGTSGATLSHELRLTATPPPIPPATAPIANTDPTPLWLQIECTDGCPVHGWNAALLTTGSDDVIAVQPVRGTSASFPTVPNGALRCALLPPGDVEAGNARLLHRRHGSEPRLLQRQGDHAVLTVRGDDLPSAWLQLVAAPGTQQLRTERMVLLDHLGHPRGIAAGTSELGPVRSGNWVTALLAAGHPIEYRGPLQVASGSRHELADLRAMPPARLRLTAVGGAPLAPPLSSLSLCIGDAIALLEPRRGGDDELRAAPGNYVLFWQQEGRACCRLPLQVESGPRAIELDAPAGEVVTFVFDYAGQPLAEPTATFDLVVRDDRSTTLWRERVQSPLSDTGELHLERRFATPIHSVLAFDKRGYHGHATAGRATTVRVAMR